jgi:hypothetical protein
MPSPPEKKGGEFEFVTSKEWQQLLKNNKKKKKKKKLVKNQNRYNVRPLLKMMAAYLFMTGARLPSKVKDWDDWEENAEDDLMWDEKNQWVVGLCGDEVVSLASCTMLSKQSLVRTRTSSQASSPQEPDQALYVNMLVSNRRGAGKKALQRLIREQIEQMRQDGTRGPFAVMLDFAPKSVHLLPYYVKMGFSELKAPWTGFKSYVSQFHQKWNRIMVMLVP